MLEKYFEFNRRSSVDIFLLGILAFIFLIPFTGSVNLFDWDEVNFAECAREMIVSGNYKSVQIHFKPFWEKPPLFIWLQAISMNIFGINSFAARLPNVVCGTLAVIFIFFIGKKSNNVGLSMWWIGFLLCSLLPHFYYRSGIIDPVFNLFIYVSIVGYYAFFYINKRIFYIIISGVFAGLSVLTKGPVSIIILCMVIAADNCFEWRNSFNRIFYLIVWLVITLVVGSSWFILLYLDGQEQIIIDFVNYQKRLLFESEAGHGQPWFYHIVVLTLGCFPTSMIFIAGLIFSIKSRNYISNKFLRINILLFFITLIIYSIAKTKIIHYSSLCYFPMTFLAAYHIQKNGLLMNNYILNFIHGLLMLAVFILLPFLGIYIQENYAELVNLELIKDKFVVQILKNTSGWSFGDFIPAIILTISLAFYLFFTIQKQFKPALIILLLGNLVCMQFLLPLIVPKIEKITQGTIVDYLQKSHSPTLEIVPLKYKTYAHLFYGNISNGIKSDTLYISKSPDKIEILEQQPSLTLVWEQNGFAAYKKLKP